MKKDNFITRQIRWLDKALWYNFIIRTFIELYLDLSISAILNMSSISTDSNWADILFSLIFIQINVFLWGFTFFFLWIQYYNIKYYPEKLERYNSLFIEQWRKSKWTINFYVIYLAWRLILSFVFAVLY